MATGTCDWSCGRCGGVESRANVTVVGGDAEDSQESALLSELVPAPQESALLSELVPAPQEAAFTMAGAASSLTILTAVLLALF